ncbi:lycopene cyclase domain-containing protein [Nocardia sp. NPDC003482]
MSYAHFLALFILPALVLAVAAAALSIRIRGRTPIWRSGGIWLGVLLVVALGWTTPWDSWIIHRGVWSYPPGSVTATLFGVPLEEYAFIAAQVLVVGVWTLVLLAGRVDGYDPRAPWPWAPAGLTRLAAAGLWLAIAVAGLVLAAASPRLLYLGSTLLWLGVPIALQRAAGADVLHRFRTLRLIALLPVVYLWVADRVAIGHAAWQVSPAHTTGLLLAGLPIEEIVFFLATSLLTVDGLVLACHPAVEHRLSGLPGPLRTGPSPEGPLTPRLSQEAA